MYPEPPQTLPSILLAHSIARLFGERIEDIFIFEEEEA